MNTIYYFTLSLKHAEWTRGWDYCTCAQEVGRVYVCGSGSHGQLGQGSSTDDILEPMVVPAMINLSVVQVAAGDEHTVMLTSLGHVRSH